MLDLDKIQPNNGDITKQVIFISPMNDRGTDFISSYDYLFRHKNTCVLLSVNEDYSFDRINFWVQDQLFGFARGQYLETMHPYTYCGKKPNEVIEFENKAKKLGILVFSSLKDCADYLNNYQEGE
jgi:hypothetical protein